MSLEPRTDASVSTRVVSWNEAADINDSVTNDALVIPSNTGLKVAGCLPSAINLSFKSNKRDFSTCSLRK